MEKKEKLKNKRSGKGIRKPTSSETAKQRSGGHIKIGHLRAKKKGRGIKKERESRDRKGEKEGKTKGERERRHSNKK